MLQPNVLIIIYKSVWWLYIPNPPLLRRRLKPVKPAEPIRFRKFNSRGKMNIIMIVKYTDSLAYIGSITSEIRNELFLVDIVLLKESGFHLP